MIEAFSRKLGEEERLNWLYGRIKAMYVIVQAGLQAGDPLPRVFTRV